MNPYVINEPPIPGSPLHKIIVNNAEGLDAVEVVLRFDSRHGSEKALGLLAAAALEVVVAAREAGAHG